MSLRSVAIGSLWLLTLEPAAAPLEGACDPYLILDSVHRLRAVVFKREVWSSGQTKALDFKKDGYHFTTIEEVNAYNIQSAHVVDGTAGFRQLNDSPLESPYWWLITDATGAASFIRQLAAELAPGSTSGRYVEIEGIQGSLDKALAQRDLFQTFSLLEKASQQAIDNEAKQLADQLAGVIATMLRCTFLSLSEYDELVASLPRRVPRSFSSKPTYSLADNYLPDRVVVADDSWMEIPAHGRPFRHFQDFGGRSFIKVYMRAPQLGNEPLLELWRRLYATHGERLHITGLDEDTPARLETMLVRSFGVLLDDGTYRDSYWPEEVILRIFKYPRSQIDPESSDFQGTLFFQYKMSRSQLLADPKTLGLRRVKDDDEQFFGFFGDVPDPRNSYSDVVSTMRSNCISCHAELFYGLNTIFSFERDPDASSSDNSIVRQLSPGVFRLRTSTYEGLRRRLQQQ